VRRGESVSLGAAAHQKSDKNSISGDESRCGVELFSAATRGVLIKIDSLNLAAPQKLCANRDPKNKGRGRNELRHRSHWQASCSRGRRSVDVARGTARRANGQHGAGACGIYRRRRRHRTAHRLGRIYAPECDTRASLPRDVALSTRAWVELKRINVAVNTSVKPMTDMDHWGVVERWNYPDDGYGDCEDYALQKRKLLMAAGWPREALLMTVVRDQNGNGHAILTVKTDRGEYVLDNQTNDVLLWADTGYRFVKRQSQSDPNVWVSLGEPRAAPATASSR
jgi:predicted transglutaminase-like cysteine proteinase